jgi:hypothetical protein
MLKHIARHNQQKAVVVYRSVPSEEHMALIVYSDALPRAVHDNLMRAVESPEGQNTPDLADVLFRTLDNEGGKLLTNLHKSGWMKKVPTNQVIVTPNNKTTIRLDELNKLLSEMAKGDEAVKRMSDLDSSRGATGKQNRKTIVEKEVGVPPNSRAGEVILPESGFLTDADLAAQRLEQSAQMKKQAEQLLAEAKRLETEAQSLAPHNVTTTKKTKTTKKQAA